MHLSAFVDGLDASDVSLTVVNVSGPGSEVSRIDDEKGTREVYDALASTDVATHVHGLDDWTPPQAGVEACSGSEDLAEVWFVVFVPPAGVDARHSALVCVETAPGTWRGFWTFDADRVVDIEEYVVDAYQG